MIMLLDNLMRIRKITADWIPSKGIKIVPVARVPREAPQRSAARQPATGLLFSPIMFVTTGNWNPQRKEKEKQNAKKYKG
jgi:hypothetical protein